jgi:hypothetical protein
MGALWPSVGIATNRNPARPAVTATIALTFAADLGLEQDRGGERDEDQFRDDKRLNHRDGSNASATM